MSLVSMLSASRPIAALLRLLRRTWFDPSPEAGTPAASPSVRFEACLAFVLAQEGGFADDPRDHGGATKFGITLATLRAHRRDPGLDAQDVRALSAQEAGAIYRERYWSVVRGQDLPCGIDLIVFDFGVNAGPARSIRCLQKALGVAEDGVVGPVTLEAVCRADVRALIARLGDFRLAYYQSLPGFAHFGAGWTARTHRAQAAALRMLA